MRMNQTHSMDSIIQTHLQKLIDATKIRNRDGFLDRRSRIAIEREESIDWFVCTLRNEMLNVNTGVVHTNIAWKTPRVQGLRENDRMVEEAGRRIAWELFDEQFSKDMRNRIIGFQNDPFYENGEFHCLSDTLRMVIDSQKASAERRYRNLIRNMKMCYNSSSSS